MPINTSFKVSPQGRAIYERLLLISLFLRAKRGLRMGGPPLVQTTGHCTPLGSQRGGGHIYPSECMSWATKVILFPWPPASWYQLMIRLTYDHELRIREQSVLHSHNYTADDVTALQNLQLTGMLAV
jgi:hypothetical protein